MLLSIHDDVNKSTFLHRSLKKDGINHVPTRNAL